MEHTRLYVWAIRLLSPPSIFSVSPRAAGAGVAYSPLGVVLPAAREAAPHSRLGAVFSVALFHSSFRRNALRSPSLRADASKNSEKGTNIIRKMETVSPLFSFEVLEL